MEKIRQRWDIHKSWQLLFPILGTTLVLLTAYTLTRSLLHFFGLNNSYFEWPFTIGISALLSYVMIRFFLWCFEKLSGKWVVTYRWEMIAIFIVFAITGSVAGKLAGPLTDMIGLGKETVSGWVYWPVRILLIFPIYQVLLVFFGWLFGQFQFFWKFEKKMLKHMGLGFLFD